MPLHEGHKYLMMEGAAQCETFTVLVCTLKSQPIPGEIRASWVRLAMVDRSNVNVIHVQDDAPEYPEDAHESFAETWTALLRKHLPSEVDAFFSSDDYVQDVAGWLDITPVLVDRERLVMPISSTAVREDPYGNWKYIPDEVRKYYLKTVAILGPESVGKSTLAEKLATHFETCAVPEYGREHTDSMTIISKEITEVDFEHIFHTNRIRIDRAKRTANKVLFADTENITTSLWSRIYLGHSLQIFEEIGEEDYFDLYLVLAPTVPWVDDCTREFPQIRDEHFKLILAEMRNRNLNYRVIAASGYQDRFDEATYHVKQQLLQ